MRRCGPEQSAWPVRLDGEGGCPNACTGSLRQELLQLLLKEREGVSMCVRGKSEAGVATAAAHT